MGSPLPPAYAIIPARYASTRFPGKPLVLLHGKPMFWHVWHRACQCPHLVSVTVATDDVRIANVAAQLHVPFVLTSPCHPSGTDRVYEAATLLNLPEHSVVVNVQGDEPALDPACLTTLLQAFADPDVAVATLAHAMPPEEALRPDKVKVVCAANGNALYFSRAPIPFYREGPGPAPCLGHIGLYAFTMQALQRFVGLAPSRLEQSEKLEQLRLLENAIPIRVVLADTPTQGVDTPEDIPAVLPLLS